MQHERCCDLITVILEDTDVVAKARLVNWIVWVIAVVGFPEYNDSHQRIGQIEVLN